MLCGAFAGVCVSFVLTPVELIKCRLQVRRLSSSCSNPEPQIQNEPGRPQLVSELNAVGLGTDTSTVQRAS